ncbi:hypothetical protein KIPB_004751 [Kipferlia bialata]|uniref:Uncharacterized protein n=1 Tax=Kipferlia bialata TaxID=797122 RepID=A0A9K3CSJ8_9EUKA|nr:hypothetical protein KIPB_002625 [Kipferlia bialata]GIQ83432.1 hypothetical protein KIPB_004751 [Kipferlia bialata]|eukprot:g2625.t1
MPAAMTVTLCIQVQVALIEAVQQGNIPELALPATIFTIATLCPVITPLASPRLNRPALPFLHWCCGRPHVLPLILHPFCRVLRHTLETRELSAYAPPSDILSLSPSAALSHCEGLMMNNRMPDTNTPRPGHRERTPLYGLANTSIGVEDPVLANSPGFARKLCQLCPSVGTWNKGAVERQRQMGVAAGIPAWSLAPMSIEEDREVVVDTGFIAPSVLRSDLYGKGGRRDPGPPGSDMHPTLAKILLNRGRDRPSGRPSLPPHAPPVAIPVPRLDSEELPRLPLRTLSTAVFPSALPFTLALAETRAVFTKGLVLRLTPAEIPPYRASLSLLTAPFIQDLLSAHQLMPGDFSKLFSSRSPETCALTLSAAAARGIDTSIMVQVFPSTPSTVSAQHVLALYRYGLLGCRIPSPTSGAWAGRDQEEMKREKERERLGVTEEERILMVEGRERNIPCMLKSVLGPWIQQSLSLPSEEEGITGSMDQGLNARVVCRLASQLIRIGASCPHTKRDSFLIGDLPLLLNDDDIVAQLQGLALERSNDPEGLALFRLISQHENGRQWERERQWETERGKGG